MKSIIILNKSCNDTKITFHEFYYSQKHIFSQEFQNDIVHIFHRKILNCLHLLLSFFLVFCNVDNIVLCYNHKHYFWHLNIQSRNDLKFVTKDKGGKSLM